MTPSLGWLGLGCTIAAIVAFVCWVVFGGPAEDDEDNDQWDNWPPGTV